MPVNDTEIDRRAFRALLDEGGSIVVSGARGAGKTSFSVLLCYFAAKYLGMLVVHNFHFMRCTEVQDDGSRTFEAADPSGFVRASNYSEAFQAERRYWRLARPDTPSVRRSREGDQVSDTIRRPSELAPRTGKVEW